ncbi:hypothetical protein AB0M43_02000 [Longispora sp. NPDC051575]|uniref:hypothetical protein n=1 Tax=Longispora sp. NPDC051575 TaxID=3154943 RepID=UPI00342DC73B
MSALPSGLAPWSASLDTLTPRLAAGLGPMVARIDELITATEPVTGAEDEFAGYGGLAPRGRPDRLLASQWLLAEEAPEEFYRRAATGQLLYLAPEPQAPRPRGRVVLLVDAGPGQAGPARLVQLASLIVLHRRAASCGAELAVGVLGAGPDTWLAGDLPTLLRSWLRTRHPADASAADVDARSAVLDRADEAWVVGAPTLAGRRRTLTVTESTWDAEGARTVRVHLDGRSLELAVPDRALAVAALRGGEFRRTEPAGTVPVPLRSPAFTSATRRLLLRGPGPDEVFSVYLPEKQSAGKPRRHRFSGPVIAAAWLGKRLVALTVRDGVATIEVVGKELGGIGRDRHYDATDLEATDATEAPFRPLHYVGGDLLVPAGGRWLRLMPGGVVHPAREVALFPRPGRQIDNPMMLTEQHDGLRLGGWHIPPDRDYLLGGGALAVRETDTTWRVHGPGGEEAHTITVTGEPFGLVTADGPALLTRSGAGLLIRVCRPDGTRTLTAWSDFGSTPVVHPTLPLIAAAQEDRIRVGDAVTGEVHTTFRTEL